MTTPRPPTLGVRPCGGPGRGPPRAAARGRLADIAAPVSRRVAPPHGTPRRHRTNNSTTTAQPQRRSDRDAARLAARVARRPERHRKRARPGEASRRLNSPGTPPASGACHRPIRGWARGRLRWVAPAQWNASTTRSLASLAVPSPGGYRRRPPVLSISPRHLRYASCGGPSRLPGLTARHRSPALAS